ncbi:MAG: NAD(P)H-binding protein [Bacteroidales bacterium]|nr:NAD(P)H-binding protein [Bacteroidales bacterium]
MEKVAAVFGSTGLVGNQLIHLLSDNKNYIKVLAYMRKPVSNLPVKIISTELTDSFAIPADVDDVYVCIGTTMRKAGSKEAFQKVDFELVRSVAQRAKDAGVKRLLVVSSIGANVDSSNFYLRTKGQMEEAVKQLGFTLCGIVRPSLLLGKRDEFRFGEKLGVFFYKLFGFIFVGPLRKYRGIYAVDVAKSMVMLALSSTGAITVESNVLKQMSDVYKS